jgi:cyclase
MKPINVALLAAGLAAVAYSAQAQQTDFSKIAIKTTDLGHMTYMLQGAGGNITVAVGEDGVIMVDSEFAPLHDKIKAAIAAVTNQPIRYVVDTHYHGDHTGGNASFAADGATIVAQVNVNRRLAEGAVPYSTPKPPGATGAMLATKTYTTSLVLKVKGRTALLRHAPHAHTDGDTYVWFADANVLSTGDTVSFGQYPHSDVANGGNIKGMIAAVTKYLSFTNDQTEIVPGHGPLGTKAMLKDYRAMLIAARDRIAKLITAGQSEQDAVSAKPFADWDAKYRADATASGKFVTAVYESLKG